MSRYAAMHDLADLLTTTEREQFNVMSERLSAAYAREADALRERDTLKRKRRLVTCDNCKRKYPLVMMATEVVDGAPVGNWCVICHDQRVLKVKDDRIRFLETCGTIEAMHANPNVNSYITQRDTLIAQIHEAIGEDSNSDDGSLPEVLAQMLKELRDRVDYQEGVIHYLTNSLEEMVEIGTKLCSTVRSSKELLQGYCEVDRIAREALKWLREPKEDR